ncbi:conserved Plasmodium protein, unknown function [Plasmodium berghei]|uniref:Uncharacterized protein n=2 Tax=Plasmodium berghei TaxID=5821 RepID=A0A509AIT9_PLABA|nr:conserved Plasmodium protein, unknown function [Plasmodium berghei ANKA]CXI09444.1 conserved Plasmodium protein, unknown function [Plasmodium berghei]SCL92859.1 conserved Plasmodium protein, unknown function [Plasmodium berghei]SCM15738.1 conserved Plasmodium protein, unknown function [Plasmodium berghei]SCM17533.1 conserved Plasmodium protein, unknown function [Plasmodium berghei]SCN22951.1 conserved Plasmodium protein, unknown function [Plasmodium berghei]|eukprot:XP_034420344.1 conserved Plasmodium protein, unknown function [Plasmodium berghei ANKA]
MQSEILKENDMNKIILNLMETKKKEVLPSQKNNKKQNLNKNDIKSTIEVFFKEQEQIYKAEESHTMKYLETEIRDKEKELNEYYTYCQNYKKVYKNNFNNIVKQTEEIKKELKDMHIEYIDSKILLENKRKIELEGMLNFYKDKLLNIKNQWENKTFCDENIKNIVYDILGVID